MWAVSADAREHPAQKPGKEASVHMLHLEEREGKRFSNVAVLINNCVGFL